MRYIFVLAILISTGGLRAQKMSTEDYIAKYKDFAIKSMQEKKVPASITLAQGILESGSGNSSLAKDANNHFGIKCHTGWDGKTYYMDDDAPNECFRKYTSVLESYEDHGDFLIGRERYKGLFNLEITDYKGWAQGLKDAGYATNPKYATLLIDLIEKYRLYEYDQLALGIAGKEDFDDDNDEQKPDKSDKTEKTNNTNLGTVFYINGLKCIKARKGMTRADVEIEFEVKAEKLNRINELGKGDDLYEGQLLFLEPKRASAEPGNNYHTVQKGETFYSIAQQYGMKMESLMKKNNMWYASIIKPGDKLWLRKKKPLK